MEYPFPHHHHHHHHFGHVHSWFGSFTDDTCVPVLETIYEGDRLENGDELLETLDSIRYSGMSTGIASAKVFDPPSDCTSNATAGEIDDVFKWYRFMYV